MTDGRYHSIVAVDTSGAVLGTVDLVVAEASPRVSTKNVFVRPSHRRRGVAAAMMREAEAEVKRLGRKVIELEVRARKGSPRGSLLLRLRDAAAAAAAACLLLLSRGRLLDPPPPSSLLHARSRHRLESALASACPAIWESSCATATDGAYRCRSTRATKGPTAYTSA